MLATITIMCIAPYDPMLATITIMLACFCFVFWVSVLVFNNGFKSLGDCDIPCGSAQLPPCPNHLEWSRPTLGSKA